MNLKDWLKNIYFSGEELGTGRRRLKFKPTLFSVLGFFLIFLACKSIFGDPKSKDDANYKTVSADSVAREGTVLIKIGDLEIRKKGKSKDSVSVYNGAQAGTYADEAQVISRKDRARGEYVLPAGTRIQVCLEGDLNSQLPQSPVVAVVSSTFSFQGKNLIPTGTKALGHASDSSDSERISVEFNQLVYPNGVQVSAQSMAMMNDGSPGIVGDYHSGRWLQFAGSLGLSFISGAAAALESQQANAFGFNQTDQSSQNAILNGLARTTLDQGKRMGDEAQNKKGYVTIPSGANFQIYFEREVDLSSVLQ